MNRIYQNEVGELVDRVSTETTRRLTVVKELSAPCPESFRGEVTTNLQRATRLRKSISQRTFKGKLL
jgi:hypothetical protein